MPEHITIRELARQLDTSERTVETYVDQLIDIDGYAAIVAHRDNRTNASGRIIGTEIYLTASAVEGVQAAMAAADVAGVDDPRLDRIAEAAEVVRTAETALEEATLARDQLIREAIVEGGITGVKIAEAAGLSKERVSQIRRSAG